MDINVGAFETSHGMKQNFDYEMSQDNLSIV
jgi:hypothetical protein